MGGIAHFLRALQDIVQERIQPVDFDTFLIFDSQWYTTRGFVVNTQERLNGVYTSDAWPSVVHDLVFDYHGDKALGEAIVQEASSLDYAVRGQTIKV